MSARELSTPLSRKEVEELRVGELVYLSGTVYGIRDATHTRMMEERAELPVSFEDQVVFHTAPSVREVDGRYEVISAGPTTSARVEKYVPEMLRRFRIRGIMGKGGLFRKETMDAMAAEGCVYLGMIGGAAALTTSAIKSVDGVYWKDLFPECIWKLRVERIGPMVVGLDAHGGNIYLDVRRDSQRRAGEILQLEGGRREASAAAAVEEVDPEGEGREKKTTDMSVSWSGGRSRRSSRESKVPDS